MLKRTTGIMIYMYRLARGGHVFGGITTKMESVQRTSQRSRIEPVVYICTRPNLHFTVIHISLVHCGSQEQFLFISSLESVQRTSQRSFFQSFVLIGIVVSDEENFKSLDPL
jgi:hypothetical protein